MPRLFTGLEVPDRVASRLSLKRGGLPGARWIDPPDYHVTLSFIGDVDDAMARDLAEALDGVRRPPVPVTITGVGAFGGARPRSVHAVVAPTPALLDLQAAQEKALRRVGAPVDERQFRPHVTLARLRSEAGAGRTAEWLALHPDDAIAFEAARFVLFSSRESTGGGPYLVEVVYPLS